MHCASCKVQMRRDHLWDCFSGAGIGLLIPVGNPISPSGHFPGCVRTGSSNSEATNINVFIHGIYKHQQQVNGGHRDWGCFCCVSWVFDN